MSRADPKTLARVRRLYTDDEMSVTAICKRTGLTPRQVYYAIRDLPKRKAWDCSAIAATVDALTSKLKQPPSFAQLGAEWGVSKSRAHAILRKCGITKPPAPGTSPSFRERMKRQAIAARTSKRRTAMMERKSKRDARIITMAKAKKPRQEIADRLGVHVNVVYRVLRSAGK